LAAQVRTVFDWKESSALVLNRGPYVIAAGLDETDSPRQALNGDFVDLFDPLLRPVNQLALGPGSRHFLVDLAKFRGRVVASSGQVRELVSSARGWEGTIEGIEGTQGVVLLRVPWRPRAVSLDGKVLAVAEYDKRRRLAWLKLLVSAKAQLIQIQF
jgi:hypothetical protein